MARRLFGCPSRLRRSRIPARHIAVAALAAVLAVSSLATLVACAFALVIPGQLDEGEPLIYGLALRMLDHQQLYQPIDRQPFVQVHYTPLYYAAVAVLRQFGGYGFAPGRLLSIVAGLVATDLIGSVAAARARTWFAGGFAMLLYLGLGFPGGPTPFLALERVDMLGTGLSVAAFAVLARRTDRAHLLLPGVLAGLALLTKQSLFAMALAGTIWLATLDRRRAVIFALTAVVTALVPALALEWSSAGAFWHNIGPDNPSPTAPASGLFLLKELVVAQAVPTLLAVVYVVSRRAWRDPALRLLVFYWLSSMISVVGIIKVGANHNYWIELAGANAVLCALCIWTCLRADPRPIWAIASVVPLVLLGLQLGLLAPYRFIVDRPSDVVAPSWTLNIPQLTALLQAGPPFRELSDHLREEKNPVLAEGMDAAVLSDHPVEFEPFAFSMLEYEGRWNSQPLVDDICAGRIHLLVLSYPIENDSYPIGLREFPMWPNSVMRALRSSMKLERVEANHWLYRPAMPPDPAAIAVYGGAPPQVLAATSSGLDVAYALSPVEAQGSLQECAHLELPTEIGRGLPSVAVLSFARGAGGPLSLALPLPLGSIAPDADQANVRVHVTGAIDLEATSVVQLADLPTSVQKAGLRASVGRVALPPVVHAATSLQMSVVARNIGRAVWLADTGNERGAIGVAVRNWIGPDGNSVQSNGNDLTSIAAHPNWNINPGQEAAFTITATAPATPGHYDLVLDMLSERVTWFEDVQGGARTVVPVDVQP